MSVKSTASMEMNFSWKVEPTSPCLDTFDDETDNWLFNDDDDVAEQLYTVKDEKLNTSPSSFSKAEVAAKLLQDLDDWVKEEPFPEWMEEKSSLEIFESLPMETSDLAISEAVKKVLVGQQEDVSDTSLQLQEFQSIYEQMGQNNASLTPPQSPTLPSYTTIYNVNNCFVVNTPQQMGQLQFIQVAPVVPFNYSDKKEPFAVPVALAEKKLEEPLFTSFEQIVPATPPTDLAHEMTEVDELVRMCADKMVPGVESGHLTVKTWIEKDELESPTSKDGESDSEVSYNYPLSPGISLNSSSSSSGDEDPDYAPTIIAPTNGTSKGKWGRKRSAKDYVSSAPDEKKMRKKEQNKNAATRYRKKKKAEIEEILGEEKELEIKNEELNKQVEDLSREIRYLKGFMRDIFKAKGLLK